MAIEARRRILPILVAICAFGLLSQTATGHPLGNFTVNQLARITLQADAVTIHYVVDMAEIPTLQELGGIDTNADGTASPAELDAYAHRQLDSSAAHLLVTVDGVPVPVRGTSAHGELLPGAGGLQTLRLESDFGGAVPAADTASRSLTFENTNFVERIGWREIVATPSSGVAVFDSDAFGDSESNELHAYPQDSLTSPLDERKARLSFAVGSAPSGTAALRLRSGRPLVAASDPFADLIAVRELSIGTALLGLLIAAGLGGMHAMSPGHGKTIVGAYLVGSRGTPKHAALLGLTVTITHTAGVFALGLVTLFASRFILPERLFPVLGFVSGLIVVVMGVTMFAKRLGAFLRPVEAHGHSHGHEHHTHDGSLMHTHGGTTHSHAVPGTDGSPITIRSLVALGVSGGLLPCPSALVVLLSAISLHRVGYGLILVVAFSVGLAAVLTGIGLAFVLAGRMFSGMSTLGRFSKIASIGSAAVIAIVGIGICYEALVQGGIDVGGSLRHFLAMAESPSFQGMGAFGVLGLGLLFGLKHATEADHVVAVSTIVSEHRRLARAALVGALWGTGHTASLFVVGVIVLVLRIAIPESVASWLELGVAFMIIGLGTAALVRGLRGRALVHLHAHTHAGSHHAHVHFHESDATHADAAPHTHAVTKIGLKPLVVGAVHGLAGSATLTLLVLTQIPSVALGILYLTVFGIGSIGGMLVMSGLVGLPFAMTTGRFSKAQHVLQIAAGIFSVVFGCWYAYESGMAAGLSSLVGTIAGAFLTP